LSEKSQSQSAIRVGPFAAIREAECEKRRQKNGSLDIEEAMMEEETATMGQRASTISAGSSKKISITREVIPNK
jgi:hypothetical protein